jgi:hypothetical protein
MSYNLDTDAIGGVDVRVSPNCPSGWREQAGMTGQAALLRAAPSDASMPEHTMLSSAPDHGSGAEEQRKTKGPCYGTHIAIIGLAMVATHQ